MSWTTDGRQPGVYLLSDEEPIRVFQQASGLVYEAASGIVVIQMAVYEPDEGGKSRLKFRPTAWLKLEEGMMLGLGHAPRKRDETSKGYPYVVRGKDQFVFRLGHSKPVGDVITFEGKIGVQANDY